MWEMCYRANAYCKLVCVCEKKTRKTQKNAAIMHSVVFALWKMVFMVFTVFHSGISIYAGNGVAECIM